MTKKSVIKTKTFAEGDIIYSHNDLSDFIYLIESGQAQLRFATLCNNIYQCEKNEKVEKLEITN